MDGRCTYCVRPNDGQRNQGRPFTPREKLGLVFWNLIPASVKIPLFVFPFVYQWIILPPLPNPLRLRLGQSQTVQW
jgi:hypothetical protein